MASVRYSPCVKAKIRTPGVLSGVNSVQSPPPLNIPNIIKSITVMQPAKKNLKTKEEMLKAANAQARS